MGAFIFLTIFLQYCALWLMYYRDKELKLISRLDIKPVKMLALPEKYRRFFLYYQRNEGIITKHAYVWMIAYYIINVVGFVVLFIQLIIESNIYTALTIGGNTDNNSSLANTCIILAASNMGLVFAAQLRLDLNPDQKQVLLSYQTEERKRREEEKRKL